LSRLVFRHLSQLATPLGNAARTGAAQGRVTRIVDAALVCEDGRIAWVGPDSGYVAAHGEAPRPDDVVLDGRGKTALPGFVDPHTHIPWAGYRESEFNERLKGKTYAEIAAAGGGIVSTVAATRAASVEELAAVTGERLDRIIETLGIEVVPVSAREGEVARGAHRRYGRGSGSPARLNVGDCFAYALSVTAGEALLFVGDDFTHTDVARARY
jgi:imidazolonepropionase-like amidohydrolase